MQRSGYTDAERAQCVLWVSTGYGATDVRRLFRNAYERQPPARSTIRQWHRDYQTRGSHSHGGANGRQRISNTVRDEIRKLFSYDPKLSLRGVAAQTSFAHSTVWNILQKKFNLYPYKLQMSTTFTEDHKASRLRFAQYCRRELRNDPRFLERIVFSDECKFSLCGKVNKENCRIRGSERPNEVYETLHYSRRV